MSTTYRRIPGRNRTISYTGNLSARGYEDNLGAYRVPPFVDSTTMSHPTVSASTAWAGVSGVGVHNFGHITGPPQKQTFGPLVTATALGASVTGQNPANYKVDGTEHVDISLTGTYSLTADVEEYRDIEIKDSGDSDFWPSYGGAAVPGDMPPFSIERVGVRLRIGGSVTASITWGGASASKTVAIDAGNQVDVTDWSLAGALVSDVMGMADTTSASFTFNGDIDLSQSYSRSGTYGSATGTSARATSPTPDIEHTCELDYSYSPPRIYSLHGYLKAMEHDYPATLGIKVAQYAGGGVNNKDVGSTFTDTYSQKRYTVTSQIDGVADAGISKDEWLANYCYARKGVAGDGDTVSLLALGEQTNSWRFMHRLDRWAGATISQAQATQIFDGGSITGWTGTHVSYSLGSGEIAIAVSGGTGQADWATTVLKSNWQSYRFLKIKIRTDSTGTFTVKIGSHEWTKDRYGAALSAGSSTGEFTLDLCAPSNFSDTSDGKTSRWPFPTVPSVMWGVSDVTTFTIKDLLDGVTYYLDDLTLWMEGSAKLDLCAALDKWETQSDTTTSLQKRFAVSVVDGKSVCIEESDVILTPGTPDTYTMRSITDIVADFNATETAGNIRYLGVTATAVASADAFFNPSRFATYLWGNGFYYPAYNDSAPPEKMGFDRTFGFTAGLSIQAQLMADQVDWYPDCGDVYGHIDGATRGAIQLITAKIMRNSAIGGVLDTNHVPLTGIVVDMLNNPPSVTWGVGNTNSLGNYLTGLSHGRGAHSTIVTPESADDPAITYTYTGYERYRQRIWFVIHPSLDGDAVEIDSARGYIHVGRKQNVYTYYAGNGSYKQKGADLPFDKVMKIRADNRHGHLTILGLTGTTAWHVCLSEDLGSTTTEVLSLTANNCAIERFSADNMLLVVYSDASDNVWYRRSNDDGATFSSEAAVMVSGTQLVAKAKDMTTDPRSGKLELLVTVSGSARVYESQDFGATFALLVS